METKDKKHFIVEKAEELFANQGFSGTSVREIAKAADVNVAMISYYFGSKEKLLMEIFRYRADYLQTKIGNLLNNSSLSWWDKLDIHIDHYVEKIKDNQHLHRIIMREVDMNSCSKVSEFFLEHKKAHFKIFSQYIREGQEAGVFNKEVDLLALYTSLAGISKYILFNQDFVRTIIKEQTGNTLTEEDLIQLAKKYLKNFFRKYLEIN